MIIKGCLKLEDNSCLLYIPSKLTDDSQGLVWTCWQILCSMEENGLRRLKTHHYYLSWPWSWFRCWLSLCKHRS